MTCEVGSRLGPYRIESELGSGGMGKVYSAIAEEPAPGVAVGQRIALKLVHPNYVTAPDALERFRREVEIGRSVAHENVVGTYSGDTRDGVWFMAMEYVSGQTLRGLLQELEKVPEELCRHVARQICLGLAAIHAAGAVHRDIKPENVMITPDHVVKIMDLGVARRMEESLHLSQTGVFVGSLRYAAPEQFQDGGRSLDGRVDLHALGLVLYELASGAHPYVADNVSAIIVKVLTEKPRRLGEVNPQLSAYFEEVVHTLLAKDRDARFRSAVELAAVLQRGEDSPWWRERARALRSTTRRPLRRIRVPRETAVYGRDPEIARLRALYDAVKFGEGRVVLVDGEAGVGKSRLVDEFVARLQQEGEDVNFLFGSYPPGGAATASGAFSTAYAEQFGAGGAEEYLREAPALVAAFEALLRGEPAPAGAQPLTKESLHTCFVHSTRALAAERPTIVLIDDLHFAPEEGRALFSALAMAVPGHRVLLVGTIRPGTFDAWSGGLSRLEHASQLSVPRLGAKDLFALLKDTFRSDRLAEELGMRIAAKTDGNPFFVFEIVRGLREGQFIERRNDGAWVTTKLIEDIRIPSSVLDLVNARVADLEEEERDLLDVASCLGFEFDPTLVAAVCGMAVIPALKRFGRIEKKHRLVRSAGASYAFDHHQVQEALYGGLHEKLRENYHASIAATLETRLPAGGAAEGPAAVTLCEQALAGGQPDCAARHLDRALDHLEAGHLNDHAAALTGRALAAASGFAGERRRDLLLRAAGFLSTLGRRDAERAALDESLRLAESGGDTAFAVRVRDALGLHLLLTGRFEEAREVLLLAVAGARAAGDARTESAATGKLGNVLYALGRYDEAHAQHLRQLEVARAAGDARGEARAAGSLGIVEDARGNRVEARRWHEEYLALCRATGDRRGEAIATANLGRCRSAEGALAAAREHYECSRAISREIGFRLGEATATGNLGAVLAREGRFAEALDLYEGNLTISRAIGDRRGVVRQVSNLGDALLALGRFDEARRRYEECTTLAREAGDRSTETTSMASLARTLVAMGSGEEARRWADRAVARAREIGEKRGEAAALQVLALVAGAEGASANAERFLREALAVWRPTGEREGTASALVALGGLLAANAPSEDASIEHAPSDEAPIEQPGLDEARALLDEGLALAREVDAPDTEILAVCRQAMLPGGDAQAARRRFEERESRLSVPARMEARLLLYKATGDRSHVEAAARALDGVLANLSAPDRMATMEVDIHKEIEAATKIGT